MVKYYVKLSGDNKTILSSFSSAFRKPEEGDVKVGEGKSRHYNLDVFNKDMLPQYKYENGVVSLKTEEEIYTEAVNKEITKRDKISQLSRTDSGLIRVIEDLIDILKSNNIITDETIPTAAKSKIDARKQLREEIENLG